MHALIEHVLYPCGSLCPAGPPAGDGGKMKEKLEALRRWLKLLGLQSFKRTSDLCFGAALALLLSALIDQTAPIHIDLIGHPGYVIPTVREWTESVYRVLGSLGWFSASLILDCIDRNINKNRKEDK